MPELALEPRYLARRRNPRGRGRAQDAQERSELLLSCVGHRRPLDGGCGGVLPDGPRRSRPAVAAAVAARRRQPRRRSPPLRPAGWRPFPGGDPLRALGGDRGVLGRPHRDPGQPNDRDHRADRRERRRRSRTRARTRWSARRARRARPSRVLEVACWSAAVAIAARIASPSAPPTSREVFTRPEARPASCGCDSGHRRDRRPARTPDPIPIATSSDGHEHVAEVAAVGRELREQDQADGQRDHAGDEDRLGVRPASPPARRASSPRRCTASSGGTPARP